jgi:branched-chain amino acid transport system ATP-binding protein
VNQKKQKDNKYLQIIYAKGVDLVSSEPLLKVSNVDVYYGSLQVLWDISFKVNSGEIVGNIGSNGSGKSTLLNTISGIIHPAKGKIVFEGKDITHTDPFKIVSLGICQVPEGGRVFPNMSVLDNLIIGSYNLKARPIKEQSLKIVFEHFPRLAERKKQLAKTLSGGERQMLAIGRGLMSNPKLMLFDEMSLGLSPIMVNELYSALREIRSRGITVILVEQNVRRSLKEADRAYVMEAGHIVLDGTARDLKENPDVRAAYFGA